MKAWPWASVSLICLFLGTAMLVVGLLEENGKTALAGPVNILSGSLVYPYTKGPQQ